MPLAFAQEEYTGHSTGPASPPAEDRRPVAPAFCSSRIPRHADARPAHTHATHTDISSAPRACNSTPPRKNASSVSCLRALDLFGCFTSFAHSLLFGRRMRAFSKPPRSFATIGQQARHDDITFDFIDDDIITCFSAGTMLLSGYSGRCTRATLGHAGRR